MRYSIRRIFLLIFSGLLPGPAAWGGACCGGGFAAPALIAGEERAQLTASLSSGVIHADVDAKGFWRRREDSEQLTATRLEGAHIFADRAQLGISTSVIRRERFGQTSSGLGDTNMNFGYEFLPDWDYNPWRPKGIGFLQLTAPSGISLYDSEDQMQLDVRGRGFWALGAGTLLSKTLGRWDTYLLVDAHRSLPRLERRPGWGGSLGWGGGISWGDWRAGLSLTWLYEDPVRSDGDGSRTSLQRYATAGLSVSRMFARETAVSLHFTDQTRFGNPSNTSLSRAVSLMVQKRWLR